jgi:steroid 5-alpha reductase family enzyme
MLEYSWKNWVIIFLGTICASGSFYFPFKTPAKPYYNAIYLISLLVLLIIARLKSHMLRKQAYQLKRSDFPFARQFERQQISLLLHAKSIKSILLAIVCFILSKCYGSGNNIVDTILPTIGIYLTIMGFYDHFIADRCE